MKATAKVVLYAVILSCLLVSGCDDDGPKGPIAPGSVEGTLTEVQSGTPVGDASVILINVEDMKVASEIAATDDAGYYRIDGIEPGEYAALVLHDTLVVRERPAPQVLVRSNRVTDFDINLVDFEFKSSTGFRIEGTVTDSQTMEPVAGAHVGPALVGQGDLDGYAVGFAPWSAVTDSMGQFSAAALDLSFPFGEGLVPISVTKEGYEPNTLIGEGVSIPPILPPLLPFPAAGGRTLTVELTLTPLPPDGTGPSGAGAIMGQLTALGKPVAGILVGVSLVAVAEPDTFRQGSYRPAPVPEKIARTNRVGYFFIDGLAPGQYYIEPAFLDNDGYITGTLEDPLLFNCNVLDSDTCDVGTLRIGRALTPLSPAKGTAVDDTTPEFRWSAAPSMEGYEFMGYMLQYGIGFPLENTVLDLTEPRWQMPELRAFSPGDKVRWSVEARALDVDADRIVTIAEFEWPTTFSVAE